MASSAVPSRTSETGLSRSAAFACALACGAIVANLYYAQPLVGLIGPELGLRRDIAGLIVTLTQLGYAAGLLLIVPLADRIENKRLILVTVLAVAAALAGLAASRGPASFLVFAMASGMLSAGAQIIIPFAAALAPAERRGQTVGNLMAGLLAGIMLSRPIASALASQFGWRAVFALSAALMLGVAAWLWRALPERRPAARDGYGAILRSLGHLFAAHPSLRRRGLYQGLIFAAFNLFWTAAPLMLADRFGLDQRGIALFGLAGAGGALIAPYAGKLGDRGLIRHGTAAAIATLLLSCLFSGAVVQQHWLWAVVIFALTLDCAVQLNQVLGQRVIFSLPGEAPGRINAVYMTMIFLLGATGSSLATIAYEADGWWGAMIGGMALAGLVGAVFVTEKR